jgi:diguanylate cyclase (GGDEF)-like protein/putative nucleotidyltransferase with HDIG domain
VNLNYLVPPLIASAAAIALLAVAVTRKRQAPGHRVLSALLLAIAVWGVLIYLMRNSPDTSHALFWDRWVVPVVFSTFVFYYQLSLVLTRAQDRKILLIVAYLALILVLGLSQSGLFISSMKTDYYGYSPVLGVAIYVCMPLTYFLLGSAIYNLTRAYQTERSYEEKNRLLWLIVAMIFPAVGQIIDLFPIMYPASIFGSILFGFCASVAVFRYHLLDVRVVIRRGLAYTLLSLIIAIPYVAIIFGVSRFFQTKEVPIVLGIVMTLLLALLLQPAWRVVQTLIDRLFYRQRYDYLKALERFSRETQSIDDLKQLSDVFIDLVAHALQARYVCLFLPSAGSEQFLPVAYTGLRLKPQLAFESEDPLLVWLRTNNQPLEHKKLDIITTLQALPQKERQALNDLEVELYVPVKRHQELVAVLLLGQKLSHQPYFKEDIQLLIGVSTQMATGLENARLFAVVEELSRKDSLTGLYNHAELQARLRQEIERSRHTSQKCSLLFIDIDGFKVLNERFGHEQGDEVLKLFAQMLRQSFRGYDVVARYGGDEFVVIMPATDSREVYAAAQRLRGSFRADAGMPTATADMLSSLDLSIGTTTFPDDSSDPKELLHYANKAMFFAKFLGGKRVQSWQPAVQKFETDPQRMHKLLRDSTHETIQTIAAIIDARDPFTRGHSQRVGEYAVAIAKEMALADDFVMTLRQAALMHDLGKIGIPDRVLTKRGALTDLDRKQVERHVNLGLEMLAGVSFAADKLDIISAHHENFDGSGYPEGLSGEDIPLEARILRVADALDAMLTERAYRKAIAREEAIKELARMSGSHFDPQVVSATLTAISKGKI